MLIIRKVNILIVTRLFLYKIPYYIEIKYTQSSLILHVVVNLNWNHTNEKKDNNNET